MTKHILLPLCWLLSLQLVAQPHAQPSCNTVSPDGWEYEIKAGFNIGGTAPLPIPNEIRSIESYNPNLALTIEANITKWWDRVQRWGLTTGLRIESKAMAAKATTKNYSMEIIGNDGNRLKGNWTGGVQTKIQNVYITIPLLATHRINRHVEVKAGLFASYLLSGKFDGKVYDGYLREGNPTGNKINFTNGAIAIYDFSHDLRRFSWGTQAGADWRMKNRWKLFVDLTWGFNDIFQKNFDTIAFAMYPIYLNLGMGYCF